MPKRELPHKKRQRTKNFRSPSQVARLIQCPGSAQEQEKITEELPHNPPAVEGTAIHALAARCLKEKRNAKEFLGEVFEVDYDGEKYEFLVNDEFVYTVNLYRNTILGVLEENGLDEGVLQVEFYVAVPDLEVSKGWLFGGTVDCCFLAGSTLHIFDLKGGRGIIVSPEENSQCLSYAIPAVENMGMFVDKVKLWIIQPRAKEGDYVKFWETTPERVMEFKESLRAILKESKEPNARLTPGEECGYCVAAAVCPALRGNILKSAQAVLPDLDQKKICSPIRKIDAESIGKALPGLLLLKDVLQQLEGYAQTLLMRGEKVPGYVLAKTNKHRVWVNEEAAIEVLSKHLQADDFMTAPKLRTPSQVEKLVPKEMLEDYITKPEGEYKVTLEKEVSDWVKRSVEDVFRDVVLD